jgi:hypothetical protein
MTEQPPTIVVPDAPPGSSFWDVRTWITVIVCLGFFAAYGLNWWRQDTEALNLMNGALIGSFTAAIGYWLGSSRGSDVKNATISTLTGKVDGASQ